MSVLGSAVQVALYDEVTYKTSAGLTLGMLGYYTECGLVAKQNAVQANTLSASRSRSQPGAGNIDVSGSYNMELAPQHVGFWLRHILGAPTTTGASAPYTHTFRPTNLPVGLLVEKNWVTAGLTNKVEHFLGCRVADATFAVPQEGACTLAVNLQGAKYTIATAPLDATLADPGHTGWFAPDVTINIAGSPSLICKSADIKISPPRPEPEDLEDMIPLLSSSTVFAFISILPPARLRVSALISEKSLNIKPPPRMKMGPAALPLVVIVA